MQLIDGRLEADMSESRSTTDPVNQVVFAATRRPGYGHRRMAGNHGDAREAMRNASQTRQSVGAPPESPITPNEVPA